MNRINAILLFSSGFLFLVASGHGKPVKKDGPGEYQIDLSPVNKATGILDCKIKFISRTVNGDSFERGVTIKGPATEFTANSALIALKTMYEAQKWEVKELSKTKLLVLGKNGSPVEKMELRVEGLDKAFHPVITQVKKATKP